MPISSVLAQADRVGDQTSAADVLRIESLGHRGLLVGQCVGEHVGGDGQGLIPVGTGVLRISGFQPQPGRHGSPTTRRRPPWLP